MRLHLPDVPTVAITTPWQGHRRCRADQAARGGEAGGVTWGRLVSSSPIPVERVSRRNSGIFRSPHINRPRFGSGPPCSTSSTMTSSGRAGPICRPGSSLAEASA
jgi:hypothetical protein